MTVPRRRYCVVTIMPGHAPVVIDVHSRDAAKKLVQWLEEFGAAYVIED
jgi:hypothetical protein